MTLAVGIDLGTTHCVVASGADQHIEVFTIPQLVAQGEIAPRELLPSFLYFPEAGGEPIVGELARKLGAQTPTRLVQSAKSWICHGGVNRRAPILPWSDEGKSHNAISPFDAQVRYLAHIRQAWDAKHAPLAQQDVVVTVPASFDEGARELTLEAAKLAGLGDVHLLEEPQAAFYDFVAEGAESLAGKKLLLVVDVGGGTTDLTLLRVLADGTLERIAVGGHLLLGGDNMDAALAHAVIAKANVTKALDPSEWAALMASARAAKELLLGGDAPNEAVISIQRRGSRLFGGTLSVRFSREEAQALLVDGFLPFSREDAEKKPRGALTTLGLPYATDPAIPRHVATFLRKHAAAAKEAGAEIVDGLPRPDGVLLNGGVFNGAALSARFSEVLARWFGAEVPLLKHTSLDTAVARGAARYALARRGVGRVIEGGSARAYYVGVEGQKALTVAPRGMNEGATIKIDRTFDLVLGRRVSFPLYASTHDRIDAAGSVVAVEDDFEVLPPLQVALHSASKKESARVTMSAMLGEQGAIELYLTTVTLPPERWRLQFALAGEPPVEEKPTEAPLPPRFSDARHEVLAVFSHKSEPSRAKALRGQLEVWLGDRGTWSATTCRALADAALEGEKHDQSSDHELAWLRLVSWCLRPGFGAEGDRDRIERLMRRLSDGKTTGEHWILWRRVAGGLDRAAQQRLFEAILSAPRAQAEMWPLLGALERVPAKAKLRAGELLWERLPKGPFWPLGRVGARTLLRGDPNDVVDAKTAELWLERLLALDWSKAEGAAFAAAMLAKKSGTSRDVPPALSAAVIKRLEEAKAQARWIEMVRTPQALNDSDAGRLLGDALPAGLRLAQ